MHAHERITLVYFAGLAIAAAVGRAPADRRRKVVVVAAVVFASVLGVSRAEDGVLAIVRVWVPLVYLLLGYWTPALLVTSTSPSLERRLLAFDRRRFSAAIEWFQRAPRPLAEMLELSYLFCYPLMPLGMLYLIATGRQHEAERYWTAILAAGFISYAPLPWLPTRPPRTIEPSASRRKAVARGLNELVLNRASVSLNTFPSGHVATSVATALAVAAVDPMAGLAFGLAAAAVTTASVVGRYHYAADAVAGLVVGVATFAASRLA
jgi:membrane-associated phospholipid phosphatase